MTKIFDIEDFEEQEVETGDFYSGTFRLSDSSENHKLDWLESFKAVRRSEDADVRAAVKALDLRKAELRARGLI